MLSQLPILARIHFMLIVSSTGHSNQEQTPGRAVPVRRLQTDITPIKIAGEAFAMTKLASVIVALNGRAPAKEVKTTAAVFPTTRCNRVVKALTKTKESVILQSQVLRMAGSSRFGESLRSQPQSRSETSTELIPPSGKSICLIHWDNCFSASPNPQSARGYLPQTRILQPLFLTVFWCNINNALSRV